MKWH